MKVCLSVNFDVKWRTNFFHEFDEPTCCIIRSMEKKEGGGKVEKLEMRGYEGKQTPVMRRS